MTDKTEDLRVEDFIDIQRLSDFFPPNTASYKPVRNAIHNAVEDKYKQSKEDVKEDIKRELFNDFTQKYAVKQNIVKWGKEYAPIGDAGTVDIKFYDASDRDGPLEVVAVVPGYTMRQNTAMEIASVIESKVFKYLTEKSKK